VKPQSKQIACFGNTQTVGLSRFLSPGKWIATSLLNVLWFLEEHLLQAMAYHQLLRSIKL
jgi:hypothetical protein